MHGLRWIAVVAFLVPCLSLFGQRTASVFAQQDDVSCVAQGYNLTSLTSADLLWTGANKSQTFAIRVCGQVETKGTSGRADHQYASTATSLHPLTDCRAAVC